MTELPGHIQDLMRDHPVQKGKFRAIRVDLEAQPCKARLLGDFDILQGAVDAAKAAEAVARKYHEPAEFLTLDDSGRQIEDDVEQNDDRNA